MQQKKEQKCLEILGVEEYLLKRRQKKDQDNYPEPVLSYSSLGLLSAFLFISL